METRKQQLQCACDLGVPPSGGSLEIGNVDLIQQSGFSVPPICSPFGGIPRNWKHLESEPDLAGLRVVPPSGGSLEIGNDKDHTYSCVLSSMVPPSGGSLEIGNLSNKS